MSGGNVYRGDPEVCRTCAQTGRGETVRGFGGREVVEPCPACKGVRVQSVPYVDLYGGPVGEVWRTACGRYVACTLRPRREPSELLGSLVAAEQQLLDAGGWASVRPGPPPDGTGSTPSRHRELADRRAQMAAPEKEVQRRWWLVRSFCANNEVTFPGDIYWGTAEEASAFREAARGYKGRRLARDIDRWLVVQATPRQVARYYPVVETVDDADWISFVSSRYVPIETVRKDVLEERRAARSLKNALTRTLGVSDPIAGFAMVAGSLRTGNRRTSDASVDAWTASNGR